MSRTTLTAAVTVILLASALPALGKGKHGHERTGAPIARGHHCEVAGVEVDKAKKDCRKAGGVWLDGPPHVPPAPTALPSAH